MIWIFNDHKPFFGADGGRFPAQCMFIGATREGHLGTTSGRKSRLRTCAPKPSIYQSGQRTGAAQFPP